MTVSEQATELLDLTTLDLPPHPKLVGIDVHPWINQADEPSLFVQLWVAEEEDPFQMDGGAIVRLKSVIRDRLRQHGIQEFAYIFMSKRSEMAEINAE